jgi:hypothetical protein
MLDKFRITVTLRVISSPRRLRERFVPEIYGPYATTINRILGILTRNSEDVPSRSNTVHRLNPVECPLNDLYKVRENIKQSNSAMADQEIMGFILLRWAH